MIGIINIEQQNVWFLLLYFSYYFFRFYSQCKCVVLYINKHIIMFMGVRCGRCRFNFVKFCFCFYCFCCCLFIYLFANVLCMIIIYSDSTCLCSRQSILLFDFILLIVWWKKTQFVYTLKTF